MKGRAFLAFRIKKLLAGGVNGKKALHMTSRAAHVLIGAHRRRSAHQGKHAGLQKPCAAQAKDEHGFEGHQLVPFGLRMGHLS